MAKYSYELKLSVVVHYLQDKGGYRSTSNKFQVEQSAFIRWISRSDFLWDAEADEYRCPEGQPF